MRDKSLHRVGHGLGNNRGHIRPPCRGVTRASPTMQAYRVCAAYQAVATQGGAGNASSSLELWTASRAQARQARQARQAEIRSERGEPGERASVQADRTSGTESCGTGARPLLLICTTTTRQQQPKRHAAMLSSRTQRTAGHMVLPVVLMLVLACLDGGVASAASAACAARCVGETVEGPALTRPG